MLALHAPSDKYDLKTSYFFHKKRRERNLPEKTPWSMVSKEWCRSVSIIPVRSPLTKCLGILSYGKKIETY